MIIEIDGLEPCFVEPGACKSQHLVEHPNEVEGHDALVVPNHAGGVQGWAPQVLPSQPQPSRLVT